MSHDTCEKNVYTLFFLVLDGRYCISKGTHDVVPTMDLIDAHRRVKCLSFFFKEIHPNPLRKKKTALYLQASESNKM